MEKKFIVSEEVFQKAYVLYRQIIDTVNKSKHGRNRRGTVIIDGISGERTGDGMVAVSIRMRKGSAFFKVSASDGKTYKFQNRSYADHRRLFRTLATA